jgi:hypothetical protein
MLTLTATVLNVFATKAFTDKKTGDITPAGHKVQLQYSEPIKEGGEKFVMKDMNVRSLGSVWEKLKGQQVSIAVGIWVDTETRKPGLYIPDGSMPHVVKG